MHVDASVGGNMVTFKGPFRSPGCEEIIGREDLAFAAKCPSETRSTRAGKRVL